MARDILLVDDSATIRAMAERVIRLTGLDVGEIYQASDGIAALACLADHEVALMLVDINMPTMNGIQLLTRMKQNESLRDIPIVIASTEGSKQRIEQLKELGVSGYLRKPFQPEKLREILLPILGVSENADTEECHASDDSF